MIKRTYVYYGRIDTSKGLQSSYRPFCGTIEITSWFPRPREAWNDSIEKNKVQIEGATKNDVMIMTFNRV